MSQALTVRECALRLNTSYGQVLKLIHAGQLRAFRLSGGPKARYRVWPTDLAAVAQAQSRPIRRPAISEVRNDTFR